MSSDLYISIGSFSLGALCYYVYQNKYSYYTVLKDIKCYNVDNELLEDLNKAGNCLPYVAVSGIVCDHNSVIDGISGVKGVIRNLDINEHSNSWLSHARRWSKEVRTLSSHIDAKPFSLVSNDSKIYVKVKDPLDSSHNIVDILAVTHQNFEPNTDNLVTKLLDTLSSKYVTGIETVERMLVAGTEITVIGEVDKKLKNITIKPPLNGLKYILTKQSIAKTKNNEEFWMRFWKYLCVGFCITGSSLIVYRIYKRFKKYQENREINRLLNENTGSAEDNPNTCVICFTRSRDVVIIPCGHVCSCRGCTEQCRICPICRQNIERLVPIYTS